MSIADDPLHKVVVEAEGFFQYIEYDGRQIRCAGCIVTPGTPPLPDAPSLNELMDKRQVMLKAKCAR